MTTVRILVTGERDWTDQDAVNHALDNAVRYYNAQDIVVVHGDCLTGADHLAELWCNKNRVKKRNTVMVKLGANIVLGSGTFDCLTKAVLAGIPVKVFPRK